MFPYSVFKVMPTERLVDGLIFFLASFSALLISDSVKAQNYPVKPVQVIVGTAPGGITDVLARMFGQKLAERLGQPFVVENRPGANGNIAATHAAKAAPDGYTLMIGTIGVMSINPYIYKSVGFNPLRDFTPVAQLVSFSNVLVVNPELPINNVQEFIAYVKARPGQLSYSSSGIGGSPHLAMELFTRMAGLEAIHSAYKGSAPAIMDVISGQVQFAFADPIVALPLINSEKLRAIGVSGTSRIAMAPNIPTIEQAGFAGYRVDGWLGFVAPVGTPAAIVNLLNAEINRAFSDPVIKGKLLSLATVPAPGSPSDFGRFISTENEKWSKLILEKKISVD